jgi:hypothetical protein
MVRINDLIATKAGQATPPRRALSDQTLLQSLQQDVLRQIDADEHHFAHFGFAIGPHRSQIAAHELVHALKNHFALGATHVQHTFVAQHAWAVNVDNGPQEILQFGRIKGSVRTENEALHIVIVVMVVPLSVGRVVLVRRVVAMLAMYVVMGMLMLV